MKKICLKVINVGEVPNNSLIIRTAILINQKALPTIVGRAFQILRAS